jgi:hypothetical protein
MSRTQIPTTSVTEVTATPENKTTFNHYKHYQGFKLQSASAVAAVILLMQ